MSGEPSAGGLDEPPAGGRDGPPLGPKPYTTIFILVVVAVVALAVLGEWLQRRYG